MNATEVRQAISGFDVECADAPHGSVLVSIAGRRDPDFARRVGEALERHGYVIAAYSSEDDAIVVLSGQD